MGRIASTCLHVPNKLWEQILNNKKIKGHSQIKEISQQKKKDSLVLFSCLFLSLTTQLTHKWKATRIKG